MLCLGLIIFQLTHFLKDVEAGLKVGINKLLIFGVGEEKLLTEALLLVSLALFQKRLVF